MEDWAAGTVDSAKVFKSDEVSVSFPAGGGDKCEISTICFFETVECELPGWQPWKELYLGARRLEAANFDPAPSLQESYNSLQLADRRLEIEAASMDITVVFGLRAPQTTPL